MEPPSAASPAADVENLLVAGTTFSNDIFPSVETEDSVRPNPGLRHSKSSFNLANVLLGKNRATRKAWVEKGFLSNCLTFTFLLVGLLIRFFSPDSAAGDFILGFGLFGFSGGITNWLAVKVRQLLVNVIFDVILSLLAPLLCSDALRQSWVVGLLPVR